jgi:two-component system, OmpR family, sensor histidine kinase ResE
MAAHDLRRPAGLIQNGCELLLEDCGHYFDDDQHELFVTVIETSRSMVRLINDFLDIAVIESGQLQLTLSFATPAELVEHSLRNCSHLAKQAGVELVFGPPEGWARTTKLPMDFDKLVQALDNLIGNAIEHSESGDRVVVESTRTETTVVLAVIDAGPGIPDEKLVALFQPFGGAGVAKRRGSRSVGLGLSIAHSIVKAHQGSLTVESRVGIGSTFRIEIPLQSTS